MKQLLLFAAIASLTQYSCRRTNSADPMARSLNGDWRMIIVKDIASGSTIVKPSFIQGDVDITFSSSNSQGGTFMGHTPTNDIQQSHFLTGIHQTLSIPELSMTKVAETSWGTEFVDNIRSARGYVFESDGRLTIKTSGKTLTFLKL